MAKLLSNAIRREEWEVIRDDRSGGLLADVTGHVQLSCCRFSNSQCDSVSLDNEDD